MLYEVITELIKHIRSEVKSIFGVEIPADREHIVGHFEVSPITKPNCPGQNYQFNEIIAAVSGGAQEAKAPEKEQESSGFKVGDIATVKKTAAKYATGQNIRITSYNVCYTKLLRDIATVKKTAAKYATGQNIADFVKGSKYAIKALKEDRALLSGINSWVYLKDLEGAAQTLKEGSKVKITGSKYATGQPVSKWAKSGTHTVSKISGEKALLGANGGINSWVLVKDLEIVE